MERLKVALLVSGWPTAERPDRGIFNRRAADQLAGRVDLSVWFLRAWLPGRRLLRELPGFPFPVTEVCLPQWPGRRAFSLALAGRAGAAMLARRLADRDLLHSVGADSAGVPASRWAERLGLPHVVQFIGSDVNLALPQLKDRCGVRGWERGVAAAVCNSDGLVEQVSRLYPELPARRIYRGVDLDRFRPLERPARRADEPLRAVYFGGLPPAGAGEDFGLDLKGGLTLQRAWSRLDGDGDPGLELLFAGPGAEGEASFRWRAGLRRPERVRVAGPLEPDALLAELQRADLLLLPSRFEGLPNLAVEAVACGTPVLASDIPGTREIVRADASGWLCPVADPDGLADGLLRAAGEIRAGRDQRESSRRLACADFDRRRWVEDVLAVYAEALGRGTPSFRPA